MSARFQFASLEAHLPQRLRTRLSFLPHVIRQAVPVLSRVLTAVVLFALCALATLAQTAHVVGTQSVVIPPYALSYPNGVAVDSNGVIYIADTDNARVLKEVPSPNGFIQSTIGTGLISPYGVAVDANLNVYITDVFATGVYKETLSGGVYTQSTIGSGMFSPWGVAVDSLGNVYVSDEGHNRILKEALSAGSYTQSVLPYTLPHGVEDLAVDSSGNLYLVDGFDAAVAKLTLNPNGSYTQSIITSGQEPTAVAVDAQGNVYVGEYYYPGDVLFEFSPSGAGYQAVTPPNTQGLGYLTSIAADSKGNIYTTDWINEALYEITSGTTVNLGQVYATGFSYAGDIFFNIDTAGNIGGYAVTSQAVNSLDDATGYVSITTNITGIQDSSEGSCAPGFYFAGQVCSISPDMYSLTPGLQSGAALLYDSFGNTIATGYAYGIVTGPLVDFATTSNSSADLLPTMQIVLGLGSGKSFQDPLGLAVDPSGNVFVADSGNSAVEEILAQNGATVSRPPLGGAGFAAPSSVALDGAGNIFVADTNNNAVEEILETESLNYFNLTGTTYSNTVIPIGSGFKAPRGVAVDVNGNVWVADSGSNAVKEVLAASGYTTVLTIGSGVANPSGVVLDAESNVFVADTGNNAVKEMLADTGYATIDTLGSGFSGPTGVALDPSENVYVADSGNNAVKEILAASGYTAVNTLGSGFIQPAGVAVDASGNVLVADSGNNRIVKLDYADAPSLTFASTDVGSTSSDSPQTVILSNNGNASFTYSAAANNLSTSGSPFTLMNSANPCAPLASTSATLPFGGSCTYALNFTPTAAIAYTSATSSLVLTQPVLNQPSNQWTIGLNGTGLVNTGPSTPQTINFIVVNPSFPYSPNGTFGLFANASSGLTVSFTASTPGVCSVLSNTVTVLSAGTCTIQANQGGNATYLPAPQVTKNFSITQATQTITFSQPLLTFAYSPNLSIAVNASSSSGLSLSLSSTTPAVCSVSGTSAVLAGAGTCTIQASQAGNIDYQPATAAQSFTITKGQQSIGFQSLPTQVSVANAPIQLIASGGLSGNPVTFTVTSGPGSIVSGNAVKFNGLGTVTVAANQSGNANYLAAPQVTQNVIVSQFLAPTLANQTASPQSPTTVILSGTVNPNNSTTEYWFNWGTSPSIVAGSSSIFTGLVGANPIPVSVDVTTFQPNTTYYYRLMAKNSGGQTTAVVFSFTTP